MKVSTGELVSTPGIYKCTKCSSERTFPQGHKVPPCSDCNNTTFSLKTATRY